MFLCNLHLRFNALPATEGDYRVPTLLHKWILYYKKASLYRYWRTLAFLENNSSSCSKNCFQRVPVPTCRICRGSSLLFPLPRRFTPLRHDTLEKGQTWKSKEHNVTKKKWISMVCYIAITCYLFRSHRVFPHEQGLCGCVVFLFLKARSCSAG